MKKIFLCVLVFLSFTQFSYSQTTTVGLGLGLEYGGIGLNGTFLSEDGFGGFVGAGYVFAGVGFNAGIQYSINSSAKTHPFIMAMYGYNAAIVVEGSDSFNKVYYGPSFGAGINIGNKKNNMWRISISVPIRADEVQEDLDRLKNSGVSIDDLPPVAIAIGYNFRI